tara:strand:- start:684 stop:971 length:288 start_codon:yes stop_codon:yes gene_type:complete
MSEDLNNTQPKKGQGNVQIGLDTILSLAKKNGFVPFPEEFGKVGGLAGTILNIDAATETLRKNKWPEEDIQTFRRIAMSVPCEHQVINSCLTLFR